MTGPFFMPNELIDRQWIAEKNPDAILWDNCDDAIVGMTYDGRAVYSIEILEHIFINDGMNGEEAMEHVQYNILMAMVGEFTPVHIYTGWYID